MSVNNKIKTSPNINMPKINKYTFEVLRNYGNNEKPFPEGFFNPRWLDYPPLAGRTTIEMSDLQTPEFTAHLVARGYDTSLEGVFKYFFDRRKLDRDARRAFNLEKRAYTSKTKTNIIKLKNNKITELVIDVSKLREEGEMNIGNIINLLLGAGRVMLSWSSTASGQMTYRPLNDRNRTAFSNINWDADDANYTTTNDSDNAILSAIQTNQFLTVRLHTNQAIKKGELVIDVDDNDTGMIDGEWFKYTTKFPQTDLEVLGIFHRVPKKYEDNCFIETCKVQGVKSDDLEHMKQFVKSRGIPMKDIIKVADALPRYTFFIHRPKIGVNGRSSNGVKKFGDGEEEIHIVLYDEHYFPYMDLPYTKFSIINWKLLHKWDDDKKKYLPIRADWRTLRSNGKDKNGNLKFKNEVNATINSMRLVQTLVKNEEECLVKIPHERLLHTQFYDRSAEIKRLQTTDQNFKCNTAYREKRWGGDEDELKNFLSTYNEVEEKEELPTLNVFFDVETNTRHERWKTTHKDSDTLERQRTLLHRPYCLCWYVDDVNLNRNKFVESIKRLEDADDIGKIFLNVLHRKYAGKYNVKLIAHNAGYDFRFIKEHLSNQSTIESGSFLICCNATFGARKNPLKIQIIDSYRMVSMKLGDFPNMFPSIKMNKEFIPYSCYTNDLIVEQNGFGVEKEIIKSAEFHTGNKLVDDSNLKLFKANCKKWECYFCEGRGKPKQVDMMSYAEEYCKLDVLILKEGYNCFKEGIKEITKNNKMGYDPIDINKCYTIAGVADEFLRKDGCYEGTYQLSGVVRAFIQKCVVGGRCMTRANKKVIVNGGVNSTCKRHINALKKGIIKDLKFYIQDNDACSLYPSAMFRMKGFLQGKPKVLSENQIDKGQKWLSKNFSAYFVEIIVRKVGIGRNFPCMSYTDDDGNREWLVDEDAVGKHLYCDNTMLEDWVKFHDIDFDIVRGYYYNEGFNNQVNTTIKNLYDGRLKLKAEGNPLEKIIKLIMNSSYGRCLMKPHETKVVSKSIAQKEKYLSKWYDYIKEVSLDEGGRNYTIKQYDSINDHFNDVAQGVQILSMSKRIMNEVMCLAEDKGLDMYYTDTDSIHINSLDVDILEVEFDKKYLKKINEEEARWRKPFIGKYMGQFHNDFDLTIKEWNTTTEMYDKKGCKNVASRKFIALGKKCYNDWLVGTLDGEEREGTHSRMKGVPDYCINDTAVYDEMLWNEDPEKKVEFDLLTINDNEKLCFKFNKDHTITNMNDDTVVRYYKMNYDINKYQQVAEEVKKTGKFSRRLGFAGKKEDIQIF